MDTKIIGYKGFDKDMKCRDFQFEVGKTYKHKGQFLAYAAGNPRSSGPNLKR
jgi:hypothetical protein